MMADLDPRSGLAVFTDGSAYYKNRSGGWAWVAIDLDGNQKTDSGYVSDTTINQMELKAPTEALLWIHKTFGSSDVLIYSDSEYVVLGSNDPSRARRKNLEWWDRLDEAINLHTYVEWNHVKGHADSEYNHLADKLAGKARKKGVQDNDRL